MKIKTSGGEDLDAWFRAKVSHIENGATPLVEDAVEEGKNITRHNIETRGTAKSGKRGRIATGEMRDGVGASMEVSTKDLARGKFGWEPDAPTYARFQEPGFAHVGGVTVEGMYALGDAYEEVILNLQHDIRDLVEDA